MRRASYLVSIVICAGLMLWWALTQRPSPHARLAEFENVCLSATSQVGRYPMPALAAGSVSSMKQVARARSIQVDTEPCQDDTLRVHYSMKSSSQTMRYEATLTVFDAFDTKLWEYHEASDLTGTTSLHQYNASRFFGRFIDDWQAAQQP